MQLSGGKNTLVDQIFILREFIINVVAFLLLKINNVMVLSSKLFTCIASILSSKCSHGYLKLVFFFPKHGTM